MRPAAGRLRAVSLEVTQLTEHTTNALKFVGDMFSARLYKLSSTKIGVAEYLELVHEKLRTTDELYGFMIEQFHQSRGRHGECRSIQFKRAWVHAGNGAQALTMFTYVRCYRCCNLIDPSAPVRVNGMQRPPRRRSSLSQHWTEAHTGQCCSRSQRCVIQRCAITSDCRRVERPRASAGGFVSNRN